MRHSSIVVQIEKVGAKSYPSTTRLAPSRIPISSISEKSSSAAWTREHVGRARLDADPDQGEQARLHPVLVLGELVVAELDVRLGVRVLGMRLREGRRHVEVGHARLQARIEDLGVEARVGGVEDDVRLHVADQRNDRVLARGVHAGRVETVVLAEPVDDGLWPRRVEVGQGDALEEGAALGDRGERGADFTGADDEDSHTAVST